MARHFSGHSERESAAARATAPPARAPCFSPRLFIFGCRGVISGRSSRGLRVGVADVAARVLRAFDLPIVFPAPLPIAVM